MFSLAHLSDLHATPVDVSNPVALLNKRFFGWLSWRIRRQKIHRPEVLEALIADLHGERPDHVVVTGDLTNVSLLPEFPAARAWLERLGTPSEVSLVPGNHDAYVPVPASSSWDLWREYLESDERSKSTDSDPRSSYPTLRVRGPFAVVGLCSALPTGVLHATGTLGAGQLERLEVMLEGLADREQPRVVSIHHPITAGSTIARRSLTDAGELRAVLKRVGAELVVHGHNHRTQITEIDGPQGAIPVAGVRSASDHGHKPHKRAQYHVFDFEPLTDKGFRVRLRTRGFDPASGRFVPEGERDLSAPAARPAHGAR